MPRNWISFSSDSVPLINYRDTCLDNLNVRQKHVIFLLHYMDG